MVPSLRDCQPFPRILVENSIEKISEHFVRLVRFEGCRASRGGGERQGRRKRRGEKGGILQAEHAFIDCGYIP